MSEQGVGGPLRSPGTARISLAILAFSALSIGLPATFAPHTFYEDFPFLTNWVDLLPPYNKHLVTDVGGLYLGFTVIFLWAARALQPTLVRAACTGWLLAEALHFLFHATNLDGFGTADAIGQLASLAFLLVPPLAAIWAVQPAAGVESGVDTTL